jgi:hypothetical protein
MENLKDLTVAELKVLAENVKSALVEKRGLEKVAATVAKAERAELFHNTLKAGDTVTFLYGRENVLSEGTVVRVSDKTVTVKSDVFAKGTNYVRFDRFVEITGSVVEETPEETVEETPEEVAV